jgi:hypothetical protein
MAIVSPAPGSGLRIRRRVDELGQLELEKLRRAFQKMMDLSDDRGYQRWAGIHGMPPPLYGQHGQLSCLPWHRLYLARFEEALAQLEPGVALPWWDWTASGEIPEAFAVLEVDDRPNPLAGGRIDSRKWGEGFSEIPEQTSREPGEAGFLPKAEELEQVLHEDSFEAFAPLLERVHNVIHAWMGGTSGSVTFCSYDPIFWIYEATIDRYWWLWQAEHPEARPDPALAAADLAPFGASVADAWDAEALGYSYLEDSSQGASVRLAAGAASDRPSVADQLKFTHYAEAFAKIICSEHTTPPLTIGIYGSWGIGKSSLLEMIAAECEKPDTGPTTVHVVEFNAWEYNSSGEIWPALVRRVMEEMEQRAQWSWWARLWDTLKRNAGREWRRRRAPLLVAGLALLAVAIVAAVELEFSAGLIAAALAALGVSGLAKVVSDAATNPVSRWVATLVENEGYGEELPYMREIRDDLRFLTEQMERGGEQPRILVMIDDLDRCEPEKAVEVLQAVNQLLDFDVFVVCLGIDARIITSAVEAHYRQLLGEAGASGYEYLDKIVQIPFRIPSPAPPEIEFFLSAQMPVAADAPEVEVVAEPSEEEAAAAADYDDTPAPSSASESGAAPEPPPATEEPASEALFEAVEVDGFRSLAPYIRSNPRHIKRLINVYRMVRTLAIGSGVDAILEDRELTIAWIVICAQWPYSVGAMLQAMRPYSEAVDAGGAYPEGEPLTILHKDCAGGLDPDMHRKLDGDLDDLRKLIGKTSVSWEQLRVLQAYTLNFNPAIEEALHRGNRRPPRKAAKARASRS